MIHVELDAALTLSRQTRSVMGTTRDEDIYKTAPLSPVTRQIVEPGAGGVEISVDKRKFRISLVGETESHVDIVVEPKD